MITRYIITLAFCIIPAVSSAIPIGIITALDNTPGTIDRQSNHFAATKGAGVEMQDAINTLNGKIYITFKDDTKVEVNEQSKLEIDEFVFDPNNSSAGKLAMNFAQGTVRYASGAIAHNDPSKVAINTPSATVSVRGTDFTATVDEIGSSTIILLPSCPKIYKDIEKDCKVGEIEVNNAAGSVILNKPFQGTQVLNRSQPPTKPVILHLTAEAINNLLIISPPTEIKSAIASAISHSSLDTNFLDESFLENMFSLIGNPLLSNPYNDMPSMIQIKGDDSELHKRLPDWKQPSGVIPTLTPTAADLCRPDASANMQCAIVPLSQNSTIIQNQGSTNITNRVNTGGNTVILLRQN